MSEPGSNLSDFLDSVGGEKEISIVEKAHWYAYAGTRNGVRGSTARQSYHLLPLWDVDDGQTAMGSHVGILLVARHLCGHLRAG